MAENIIVRFNSPHQALKAEKTLMNCDLKCKMIPIPKELSPDCGIALQVNSELKQLVEVALVDNSIEYEGFYDLNQE